MKYFGKEAKIGLAGIIALCILVYGINYLKGIQLFKPSSYFYVQFKDINGLTKSSPVFADGYRVGIVSNIAYDYSRNGKVVAEISVEPDLRIPKGSTAELTSNLLGGINMNLLLANNPRERCNVGDTIYGHVNNGALGQASEMIPQIQEMMPKLDSILTSINNFLGDPALINTLHHVEAMTSSLAATSRQLERLSQKDLPAIVQKLDSIENNFIAISGNLKDVDYAASFAKLDATLSNVKELSDKLTTTEGNIGLLLNDTALYNNLTQTTLNAATLLEDIRLHPKRYINISVFGKKDK